MQPMTAAKLNKGKDTYPKSTQRKYKEKLVREVRKAILNLHKVRGTDSLFGEKM